MVVRRYFLTMTLFCKDADRGSRVGRARLLQQDGSFLSGPGQTSGPDWWVKPAAEGEGGDCLSANGSGGYYELFKQGVLAIDFTVVVFY